MSTDIDIHIEPLPGYRLLEHIGSGGYGEVWKAEAPGGLYKAIKFVFGQQHEKRATNELRALDHVRSVRHPFLLSLERIEVVDGRLLVVSELADGSVKDRFDACRRDGMPGIPRSELLGYLRDAADALDFMSESHALQHLDIKPENLLLLAGHVKVADFGLVKDVRQSQASLVGGMTPLYAAPEVFRGTPSRQSDQYSLAIVYQEMLTGTLPFAGGNAAELTLQHLNDEPDLTALSPTDRYSVSRAMSKDPLHRYTSCREFIESLLRSPSVNGRSSTTVSLSVGESGFSAESDEVALQSPTYRLPTTTDVFDDGDASIWGPSQDLLVKLPPSDHTIRDLPPCDLNGLDSGPVPTVVLGIGGTAGRVLTHFRKLMRNQFGDAQLPAIQCLLLDTDSRALSASGGRDGGGLTAEEILALPLRRPQHYRDNAQQLLTWLSRRWLYNIPRSLRTEGLRPLGRLALADHARQAGQRIRRSITQAMDTTATEAATQVLGRSFRTDAAQVYVVASISGGTGGGMSLDVAFAVRAILQKLGIDHAHVTGLMLHSTGGDPRSCELARVNALSWLTEYHHFDQLGNPYPGDASCGLPAHDAGVPAFDSAYLVHLGDNLNEVEFDTATQNVAEYLRINTLTAAGSFFEANRDDADPMASTAGEKKNALRSFGLHRRGGVPSDLCDEFANTVSQQVISSWRHEGQSVPAAALASADALVRQNPHADSASFSGTQQLIQRLHFDSSGIAANARMLIELEFGNDGSKSFLNNWLPSRGDGGPVSLLKAIDSLFAYGEESPENRKLSLNGKPIATIVEQYAEKLGAELQRWVLGRIDEDSTRLVAAGRCAEWLLDHCRKLEAAFAHARLSIAQHLLEIRSKCSSANAQQSDAIHGNLQEYFDARLDHAAVLAAEHVVHLVMSDARRICEELAALGREVDQVAAAVQRACGVAAQRIDAQSNESSDENPFVRPLQAQLPAMVSEVNRRLQAEYIRPQGGLARVILGGGRPRAQLTAKLHELSRQAVQQTLSGASALDNSNDGAGLADELRSGLASATPALLEFGGTRRTLAIVPREGTGITQEVLSNLLGTAMTVTTGDDNNFTICVEANELSLPHIAASFVEYRRDRVEFAGRVHSRTDIAWTPLIETSATSEPVSWPGVESRQTQSREALCKTLVM